MHFFIRKMLMTKIIIRFEITISKYCNQQELFLQNILISNLTIVLVGKVGYSLIKCKYIYIV